MSSSPSSSANEARRALGRRLKAIRTDANLSARELASRAGWGETKVSKLQSAVYFPSDDDLRTWATLCGAAHQIPDLIATAHNVEEAYVEWRQRARNGLRAAQESAVPLYERTRHFRVYESSVIPGLLQTPEYARALISKGISYLGVPDDADDAVAARIKRQSVLYRDAHTFAFLVEESGLKARLADDEVMVAQYGHLLKLSTSPRLSLGVIPGNVRREMYATEGFWIFGTERVVVEILSAEIAVTQPREIELYERTFVELAELAVYGAECRALIASAITSLV
ncbi:MAG: helix-turn-helix domain-containing protein [Sinomonas sp.]|nr:helix-turn-helix domain-containing protein [Sinomonas sp.]